MFETHLTICAFSGLYLNIDPKTRSNRTEALNMNIKENQELRMSNILSFRKRLSPADMPRETERIGRFIESGGYQKTGPTVTATFAVEQQDGAQILDVEVLVPLDKPFTPPEGCTCKPEFLLTNAVTIRHTGNPAGLQETCNQLMAYIQEADREKAFFYY